MLKQPLQGSLHLISGVVLEFYRQICRKLIRIVVDFIKVIPKGKRIITVCRDGSMYLSRILSRELSLHAGNRLCIARDEDRPKDWYMFVSDDGNGFTIWNDPRCARFSNSFIAGMILDAAKVEKCAGFMVAKEPVNVDGRLCYRIILDNPIPKGVRATGTR